MVPITGLGLVEISSAKQGDVILKVDAYTHEHQIVGIAGSTLVALDLSPDAQFALCPIEQCDGMFGLHIPETEIVVDPLSASGLQPEFGGLALRQGHLAIYSCGQSHRRVGAYVYMTGQAVPSDRRIWFRRWSIIKRLSNGDAVTLFSFDANPER